MTSSTRPASTFSVAALACAIAGAAVFQFWGNANQGYIHTASLFYWWGFQWFNPASETEHGTLILAISAWLFWRNLREGRASVLQTPLSAENSKPGVCKTDALRPAFIAMALGLALHAIGFVGQQARISIAGLLVFVWGGLRLGGGRAWGRAAVFPLGFLIFAIPINALDSIGFWLRMWVIEASAWIAHGARIGVLQSGTQLLAADGRFNYDVAAACSGVRSLTALAALSLLAGYLNFRGVWRRGLVLLLCFPLVYLGNVARIVSIVFAAQWGGPTWGERAHDGMGYGVFVIVLGGVLLAIAAIRRFAPEGRDASPTRPELERTNRPETQDGSESRPYLVVGLVVVLAVGEAFFLHRVATQPARGLVGVRVAADGKDPADLPAILGRDWVGVPAVISEVERQILPPDTGYARMNYTATRDRRGMFLSIVLSGRDRTSIHRPELCLVGQGWTIEGRFGHEFEYRAGAAPTMPADGAEKFPATVLRVRREIVVSAAAGKQRERRVVPQLVAYWFVGGDGVVATHWQRLARDTWNRLVHGRADRWAYVLMQTDSDDGEAAALARMQAVLNETLPAFQQRFAAH